MLGAWGLEGEPVRIVQHFHNTTLRVGRRYALRVARPGFQSDAALRSEVLFLEHVAADGFASLVPVRTTDGDAFVVAGGRRCLLFEWIPGRRARTSFGAQHARAMGELAARFHERSLAFRPPLGFERRGLDADSLTGQATGFPRELVRSRLDAGSLRVIDRAAELVRAAWEDLDLRMLIHGDLIPANTLWIGGRPFLIDFDDLGWAPPALDLAVARAQFLARDDGESLWEALLAGYESVRGRPPGLDEHLEALVAARRMFVACWIAGNLDQPAFRNGQVWIDEAVGELRRFASLG